MKPASVALFAVGVLALAASMFMPVNRDWLGFFWATFSFDVMLRGPQKSADYALFAVVSAGNVLAALSLPAFAWPRALWARFVGHMLMLATTASVIAAFKYRPGTWSVGFHVWCVGLFLIAVALYVAGTRRAAATPAVAAPPARRTVTPLRKTGT